MNLNPNIYLFDLKNLIKLNWTTGSIRPLIDRIKSILVTESPESFGFLEDSFIHILSLKIKATTH